MGIIQKLTPETFLSSPRRGPAVPNQDGTLAFFTVSTHSFAAGGSTKKEVVLLDLGTGKTWPACGSADQVHDITWIPEDASGGLLWLQPVPGREGETAIVVTSPSSLHAPSSSIRDSAVSDLLSLGPEPQDDRAAAPSYEAGTIPAPVRSLKLCALTPGCVAIAVVGLVGPDGGLFNGSAADQSPCTARTYDTWNVRQWDSYVKPQKYSIWYSRLVKADAKWSLAAPFQNALRGTDLESPDRVHDPGDAGDAFDLGRQGIAFVARTPDPDSPECGSCTDVYFVPLESFTDGAVPSPPPPLSPSRPPPLPPRPRPVRVNMQGRRFPGWCASPRFSPDGTMLAHLKSPLDCYSDTKLLMGHVGGSSDLGSFDVFDAITGKDWHLRPSRLEFEYSGQSLLLTVEDCGRVALYSLSLRRDAQPTPVFRQGCVSGFHTLRDAEGQPTSQLLVSSSSLLESSVFHVVDGLCEFEPRAVAAASKGGAKFGLDRSQVSEIYFEGAGDYCVQAWVVTPSDFDESKKYPLILTVHGGPADASRDEWHMRWNPVVWAEQGYVVVLPNVTGSVGFGVDFTAGMFGQWGGRPYEDLECCMKHLSELPYVDLDRAVAAGAGYGGYMINWILGHPPLARRFKALLCQDGIFNLPQAMLQRDLLGDTGEFKGPPFTWRNYTELAKWNPARPDLLRNWAHAPPTLVVHGEQDFRVPVTEGLAAFRALQLMGVPSRLLTFPDENHWVQKPENALEWHRVVLEWFGKYVGGGAAGGGVADASSATVSGSAVPGDIL